MLLAPITEKRYAADCIGIVDIIYTPILILTLLLLPLYAGLVKIHP